MRLYLYLGLFLVLQSVAFYAYYKYEAARSDALEQRVAASEKETKNIEESFAGFKGDLDRSQKLYDSLNNQNQAIAGDISVLKNKFRTLDLDATARVNPSNAQTQVNTTINSSFTKLQEVSKGKGQSTYETLK